MAKIYARKIQASGGTYTLDMVPARWREAVAELLGITSNTETEDQE